MAESIVDRAIGIFTASILLVAFLPLSSGQAECGTLTCGECIAASPDNVWCSEGTTDETRCFSKDVNTDCIVENPRSFIRFLQNERLSDTVQVTPQRVEVNLRPGENITFVVGVKPASQYPFDLYMLMDVSGSLNDDVQSLQALGSQILDTLATLTRDFAVGFGTFVDKPIVPYVPEVNLSNAAGTCKGNLPECETPHSFYHYLSMTNNSVQFQGILNSIKTSSSIDTPESGLDALVQALRCREIIGWRDSSVHMLLLLTDANYHSAGDGKLGFAVLPNDGKCHLVKNEEGGFYEYKDSTIFDYPSIFQVNSIAVETNTLIVFAVTQLTQPSYQDLAKEINNGIVAIITDNSSNIIDVIRNSYLRGREEIVFQIGELDSQDIQVSITADINCSNTISSGCVGVPLEQEVTFNVTVSLKSCLEGNTEKINLAIPSLGQQVEVIVNPVCQCDCEENPVLSSANCSGSGSLTCGLCVCDEGRFGCNCECTGDFNAPQCPVNSNGEMCSGRGQCTLSSCLQECECNEEYVGDACECKSDNCKLSFMAENCEGRGSCNCSGCTCDSPFSGSSCQCDESTCVNPGTDEVCSGVGTCECSGNDPCMCRCKCPPIYGLPHCGSMLGLCVAHQNCSNCVVQELNCTNQCNVIYKVIDPVNNDEYMIDDDIAVKCRGAQDICPFFYYVTENNSLPIHIERCPGPGFPISWAVPLIVVVAVLFLGLLALIMIKAILLCVERLDYKKFVNSMQTADWAQHDNPLYVNPQQSYKNVVYKRKRTL